MQWMIRSIAGACLLGVASTPAFAQDPASSDPMPVKELDEVVVLGTTKRAEDVQKVPISVTALGAADLEAHGIRDVSQIDSLTPNVEIDSTSPFSGSNSVLSPFIRGIGQNDFAFNLEPGVGVYVDGVYYARTIGAVVDMLDIERVEVQKGPQGTLFGRNTIGGAINVVTRRPSTDELDYRGEVTVGRFGRLDVRGALDVPLLSEKLYSQLAFSAKRADGYQKRGAFPGNANSDELAFRRSAFDTPHESGGENQNSYRGKLLWLLNDSVELSFSGDYSHVNEQATPATLVGTDVAPPAPGATPTLAFLYNTCISTPPDVLAGLTPSLEAACGARAPGLAPLAGVNTDADPSNDRPLWNNQFITNKDRSFATGSNFSKLQSGGFSTTLNWELSDTVSLKSISAYRRIASKFGVDLDGSPIDIADLSFNTHQNQYSEEVQLSGSTLGLHLDWLLGGYYFHERGDLTDYVPFAEGLVQVFGANFFKNEAYAAFSNMTYHFTDALGLTLGVRYTNEDKTFEGRQRDLNSFPLKTGFPLSGFPDPSDPTRIYPIGVQHKDFDDLSARVSLQYAWTDNLFSYASYSQGTKSGGWTTRLLVPESPNPNRAPDFDPETADAYEIGLKSRFFDDRLQLNLAAFHTLYHDIQVTVQRNISPTLENAGQGRIRGVELEFDSLIGAGLRLGGGIGVLDAEYTRLDPKSVLDRSDRFVNTPDFSANLSAAYTVPLELMAIDGSLRFQMDFSHKRNIANDAENNPLFFQNRVNLIDAAITYAPTRSRWELTLGVHNLTDTRVVSSGFQNPGIGFANAIFSRPREYYATVRVRR